MAEWVEMYGANESFTEFILNNGRKVWLGARVIDKPKTYEWVCMLVDVDNKELAAFRGVTKSLASAKKQAIEASKPWRR